MIVTTQFEVVKETMKKVDSYNNYFPYVRLPYFCCFKVKNGKKEFFKRKSNKIVQDVYSEPEYSNDRAENALTPGIQEDLG